MRTLNLFVSISPMQNECSFVSLRDVKRAMIVFEYFYEKMDSVFAPLMDKRAQEDYNERYAVRENAKVYTV